MATTNRTKLNFLYRQWAPGTPLTSDDLAALGVSADLAVHYARAGWLSRLARGVYRRPNDTLDIHACLTLMQRSIEGLHVGGKSALDWYGVRQYLSQQSILHLYGWTTARLPNWFTERFPAEYHRKRLFDEPSAAPHAGGVWRGLGLMMLNPKAGVFWVSLTGLFITPESPVAMGLVAVAGAALMSLLWHGALALAFTTSMAASMYRRMRRPFEAVLGVVLTGLGLRLIAAG